MTWGHDLGQYVILAHEGVKNSTRAGKDDVRNNASRREIYATIRATEISEVIW